MLGLSPTRLRAYVKAGLLCPQRGHGGELRFSFQDLLLLRTAEGLVTERLPPRRVRDALMKLRRRMPTERPLTGVQLGTEGEHVVVRDGGTAWRADSGQGLLSFDARPADGQQAADGAEVAPITFARRPPPRRSAMAAEQPAAAAAPTAGTTDPTGTATPSAPTGDDVTGPTADDFFQLGCSLEDGAPQAARVAYQNVLLLDPRHPDAHVNLGRLVHESGNLPLAEKHYRAALALRPTDSTAHFNLGVVLEDQGRPEAAVETYEATLRVDPTHADAHFNAARLHDLAGRYEAALRHLRAYRNLTSG